jgi:hypothetical protein
MSVGISMERLLEIALELPEVQLHEWDEYRALKVRGKSFGYLSQDNEVVLLKAMRQEQAALIGHDPQTFSASHTSGRFGWVEIQLARIRPEELAELLDEAWSLSAPKGLVAEHRKHQDEA